LTIALSSSAAFAQAVQNPPGPVEGTPAVTGSVQGGASIDRMTFASDDERAWYERNWDFLGGFFTDDTMTTLRSEDEIRVRYESLLPEQQQALADDCTNVTGDTSNAYGKSVTDLCSLAGAGPSIQ
jgi:hypothetical protein